MMENSEHMPATTVVYGPRSAPKHRNSINTTVGALTESRVGGAPGAPGALARLPSGLADVCVGC